MSLSLSNAAIQQFQMSFNLKFQAKEKLRNTCKTKVGVVGDAYKMPFLGTVPAQRRGAYQSAISASPVPTEQKIITFEDWTPRVAVDKFQELMIPPDVLSEYASLLAMTMGRINDQTNIDALDAGKGTTIPVGTTNLTVEKLRAAKKELDYQNVEGDRYIVLDPSQMDSLLAEDEITNVLYNNQRTLVDGKIGTFLGMKFITMSNMADLPGLPKTGDNRSIYVWSHEAITRAFRKPPSVEMYYDGINTTWLATGLMSVGAKVGQSEGVVEILCDETK